MSSTINESFFEHASDILADTKNGLSGALIV